MNKLNGDAITRAGLDMAVVIEHQRNVTGFIKEGKARTFPIVDTCRIDNGGIIKSLNNAALSPAKFVSFIPAAGASSRWLAALNELIVAASREDRRSLETVAARLVEQGFLDYPLPPSLRNFLEHWATHKCIPREWSKQEMLPDIEAPKALYPAVIEGKTFLELKHMEDTAMGGLGGEVFICPPHRVSDFENKIQAMQDKASFPVKALEQGLPLATVRWNASGEVCADDDGAIASVPAGHGSLLKLLPRVKDLFPSCDSAWIRNIDNVMGTSQAVVQASKDFLGTHEEVLKSVKSVRVSLAASDMESAARTALLLAERLGLKLAKTAEAADTLAEVAKVIFHAPLPKKNDASSLSDLYARLVVTMGQVPNTLHDVGGTAVFTTLEGQPQKLCLELPHASSEDRKQYLEDPTKATHFNPVFVAVELPTAAQIERWRGHPFWLIAKKSWRNQDVWYQESILYEMLGSSAYTNLVFVEIPRVLFNPHKALADAKGRRLAAWK